MNLAELIEAHGTIVAADPTNDTLVCWDAGEHVFTIATGNQNGAYEVGSQYDGEGDRDPESAMDEAAEILGEELGEGESD